MHHTTRGFPHSFSCFSGTIAHFGADFVSNAIALEITVTWEAWPTGLFGDFDGNCEVDVVDIMQVACRWQTSCENPDPDNDPDTPNYDAFYDVNKDCVIDIEDIVQVAACWGDTC